MFKRFSLFLVLGILSMPAFAQDKHQEKEPWFDMENCEMCKPMAKHADLMLDIKWETYLLNNGFMSVTVVPEKAVEPMNEAKAEMEKVIARAMSGEEVKMCQHCQGYGTFMMKGANMEEHKTVGGDITIVTSTDPEVVEMLHDHATKTQAAHEAMVKEMKGKHDHEHDHDHKHDDKDHDHKHDKDGK